MKTAETSSQSIQGKVKLQTKVCIYTANHCIIRKILYCSKIYENSLTYILESLVEWHEQHGQICTLTLNNVSVSALESWFNDLVMSVLNIFMLASRNDKQLVVEP